MAADEKWYFTKEQLANTPSRKCGIDADKELSYRQQAANFIQDMGQRLSVTQLCINTAIVYMHRFYVFHSLSQFHRNAIATAALFLAAKVEEQPRKLEHVIKVAHVCLHKDQPPPDVRSEQYLEQAQDVVFNENVLLQTLGFDVAIDHPHTHVVRCCHLVKASKDLAQASYFMASNSLHMTTMCLQYKPTVVACFCIHLACKWSNWEIPQSNEGKHWFWYVDRSVTCELLQQLTSEFLHIFDNCPSRLKRRIKSISAKQSPSLNHPSLSNSPFDTEPRQVSPAADGGPTFQSSRPFPLEETKKSLGPAVVTAASSSSASSSTTSAAASRPPVDYREYREKKERERLEREKAASAVAAASSSSSLLNAGGTTSEVAPTKSSHHSHSHHGKQQTSQGGTSSSKHPIVPGSTTKQLLSHHNHHGAHRNEIKAPQPTQRHSTSSSVQPSGGQTARPARIPRDYSAAIGINAATYQHQTKDATSLVDGTGGIIEIPTISGGSLDDGHGAGDKMTNHIRGIDAKHDKMAQQRGAYDPRHKILEHGGKELEQKNYAKYQQEQQQRGRKIVDSVEQRSEEVRKLIEKPLPLPKGSLRPEMTSLKEDYSSGVMKHIHSAKYPQQQTMEKQSSLNAASLVNMSHNPHDYGLAGVANRDKATSGLSKAGNPQLQQLQQQQQQHANVPSSAIKKFDAKSGGGVKNGSSQMNATQADDSKSDKRSRHQFDDDRLQQGASLMTQQASSVQQVVTGPLIKQHKSLFSPEKTTNPRETHGRMSRSSRQKTPPSTGGGVATSVNTGTTTKSTKIHERVPDQSSGIDHVAFDNSQHNLNHQNALHHHHHHHHQQQQHHSQNLQESSGRNSMSHKRHRISSIGDSAKQQQQQQQQQQQSTKIESQQVKMESQMKSESTTRIVDHPSVKVEMDENYESMKMLGRVPELLQPIRDSATSTNGRTSGIHAGSSLANDLKLPELIKPFEPETIARHAGLTNGLDGSTLVKREDLPRDSQDSGYSGSLLSRSSQDYLSPMKSAQSISALLQEPLAPMPSLLQGIGDYGLQQQASSLRSYQYGDSQQDGVLRESRQQQSANVSAYQQSCQSVLEMTSSGCEKDVLSTVDTTALSAPQQTIAEAVPIATNHQTISAHQRSSNEAQMVAQVATLNDEAIAGAPTTSTATTTIGATVAVATTTAAATTTTTTASSTTTSRKSSHHKSEKKKKKDKHKHKEKDKDKSKDKKKTKHKDKEKEKHIKITIPKDKLNLSTENNTIATLTTQSQCGNTTILIGHEKKSPQTSTTGLKIKIPKDRLKSGGNDSATSQTLVQAPLKIKIRTTVGDNSESTISMSTSSSRKRDRAGMEMTSGDAAIVAPPTKKQHPHHHSQGTTTMAGTGASMTMAMMSGGTTMTTAPSGMMIIGNQQQQQQQHPPTTTTTTTTTAGYNVQGQRQNGRHYSSNNKEKHTSSSHHKNSSKLSQQQQQQLLLQQQQQHQQHQQHQHQHHQHSHPT